MCHWCRWDRGRRSDPGAPGRGCVSSALGGACRPATSCPPDSAASETLSCLFAARARAISWPSVASGHWKRPVCADHYSVRCWRFWRASSLGIRPTLRACMMREGTMDGAAGRWDYDLAVIGEGPCGSSVATALARRGRSVVVPERERFPRFTSANHGCRGRTKSSGPRAPATLSRHPGSSRIGARASGRPTHVSCAPAGIIGGRARRTG